MVSTSVLRYQQNHNIEIQISSVGNPYEFALAKPTVEGTGKTMCLTFKNWILNNLILEYDQFWKILILDCELRLLSDRIVTYNLDFMSFHTREVGM